MSVLVTKSDLLKKRIKDNVSCFVLSSSNPSCFRLGDTDSDDEEQIPQLVAPNRLGGGKEKPIIFTHTFKSLEESSNLHV